MVKKLPAGIERRGKNSFRLMVSHGYVDGKQQRFYRTIELREGMTERAQIEEATRQRALFLAEVERGEVTNARQITVSEFSREWLENTTQARGLSPVTLADYRRTLDNHILPALGGVKLHKLTPLSLTRFYNSLKQKGSARGGQISGRYVQHIRGVLRTMLNAAVKWGYLPSNPDARADAPRNDTQEAAIYDAAQCARLLEALNGAPFQYRCAVTLALFSQVRKGELAGLDWTCVDFERGAISIQQNAVYLPGQGVILKEPKTRAGNRSIKVPDCAMDLLKELKRTQAQERLRLGELWQDSGAVFTQWNGARIHPDTIPKWFTDFLEAQGLPHIRFHALRHTGASLLISGGENVSTVSRRLGHANTTTTLDIYAHAFEALDVSASDLLEDSILGQNNAHKRQIRGEK